MNEKEQIEKLAEVISVHFQSELDLSNDIYEMATSLYKVGYRKQSDTIKEFVSSFKKWLFDKKIQASIEGEKEIAYVMQQIELIILDKLAKEYGVE